MQGLKYMPDIAAEWTEKPPGPIQMSSAKVVKFNEH